MYIKALPFIIAGIAQSVEQLTCNQQVAGSSPIASYIRPLNDDGIIY